MFYVFLVGLAKLHCGATPPSVMVLFTIIMLFDLKSLKQDSIHGSTEYLINVANRMFDFPQLISKRLTSPDF